FLGLSGGSLRAALSSLQIKWLQNTYGTDSVRSCFVSAFEPEPVRETNADADAQASRTVAVYP
ncbi:MAG: hypothetical protein WBF07_05420, partial [Xanthobacteraceae bacterium]